MKRVIESSTRLALVLSCAEAALAGGNNYKNFDAIRDVVARDMYVRLEGPSQIGLFVYDNDSFIVESLRESGGMVRLVADKRIARLRDLVTGQELTGEPRRDKMVYETMVRPGSYRVFTAR